MIKSLVTKFVLSFSFLVQTETIIILLHTSINYSSKCNVHCAWIPFPFSLYDKKWTIKNSMDNKRVINDKFFSFRYNASDWWEFGVNVP